jgi:SAM-dependent methyltransferase
MATDSTLPKAHLRVPPPQPPLPPWRKLARYTWGAALAPLYWLLAHRFRTPGLGLQRRCFWLGLRLFARQRTRHASGWAYELMFRPMDSTRYFELDFAWQALADQPLQRYLDVSSPRLFPVLLLDHQPGLRADLVNPDANDLYPTSVLVEASGVGARCRLHPSLIEAVPFAPASFDAITSISVIEHIPDDTRALRRMWDLLQPGGLLVISVPCAAEASEQYLDHNEYGLLAPDAAGFVFYQRFYSPALLAERILSVTGAPRRQAVYGEKRPGLQQAAAYAKRASLSTHFPVWREPYVMGRDFARFPSLEALPGEGVISLEFVKP